MGVHSYESEASCCIAPAKLFKAFAIDGAKLLPKVVPHAIKSCEILEGNGGPGTINQISFVEGSKSGYVKNKVNVVDTEKWHYSYTVIEGEGIGEKIEKIEKEIKIEAKEDGGSTIKSSSKYYTIGDYEMKEEEIAAVKGKGLALFKAMEAYLLANPDSC